MSRWIAGGALGAVVAGVLGFVVSQVVLAAETPPRSRVQRGPLTFSIAPVMSVTFAPVSSASVASVLSEGPAPVVATAASQGGTWLALKDNATVWSLIGDVRLKTQEHGEAAQCYARAHRLHPKAGWLGRLADVRAADALTVLEALSRERPDDPAVLQALARVYGELGRTTLQIAVFTQALSKSVGHWSWCSPLQELAPHTVEEILESHVERSPKGSLAYLHLARLHESRGQRARAVDVLTRALIAGVNNADVRNLLVTLAPAAAARELERQTRLWPKNVQLWRELAKAYRGLKHPQREAYALARVSEVSPSLSEIKRIAELDPGQATPLLATASFLANFTDHKGWGDLGDAYRACGQTQLAVSAYRKAHSMNRGELEWIARLNELGESLCGKCGRS